MWVPGDKFSETGNILFEKSESKPQCEIYVSEDFFENEKKLLCLIHGTGNVRAG